MGADEIVGGGNNNRRFRSNTLTMVPAAIGADSDEVRRVAAGEVWWPGAR